MKTCFECGREVQPDEEEYIRCEGCGADRSVGDEVVALRARIAELESQRAEALDKANAQFLRAELAESRYVQHSLIESELRSQVRKLEQRLGNLLARIHRDGGHYIVEHGWEKAEEDADARVVWLSSTIHELAGALEVLLNEAEYRGNISQHDGWDRVEPFWECKAASARARAALELYAHEDNNA